MIPFLDVLRFVVYAISLILGSYILYRVAKRVRKIYTSPLRNVPGPIAVSWIFGSFDVVPEADAYRLFERWTQQWGPTFRYSTILKTNRLYTIDLTALTHILASDVYQKSNILVRFSPAFTLGQLGKGLLFVEGIRHQQLRKIMNVAFSSLQIRGFTDMFLEKSIELRDIWASELTQSERTDGKVQVDALKWLNKLALDTIGLAGFDYHFNSLHVSNQSDQPNELLKAVRDLFDFDFLTLSFLVQLFFPLARMIPTERSRTSANAIETIRRVGNHMVAVKKASISSQASRKTETLETKDVEGSDLLSLLIKSNMATDVPEDARMTHEEILSQIPSVLLAGHETTATSVTWTLFALATNLHVQTKLRTELLRINTDIPNMNDLNGLPYLDAVVREALRLHAPVAFTERVVTREDVIPLRTHYFDTKGVEQNTVRVAKGDKIFVPIRAVNRSKELWGLDAEDFKPERWLDDSTPQAVRAIPGVWSNIMSFLVGSHACIGYRVALMQMKAMLFVLVRAFEFELAVSAEDIGRRNNIVGRPYICSDPDAGTQLPLLIRSVKTD